MRPVIKPREDEHVRGIHTTGASARSVRPRFLLAHPDDALGNRREYLSRATLFMRSYISYRYDMRFSCPMCAILPDRYTASPKVVIR